jgi:polyphosphate glucokinase
MTSRSVFLGVDVGGSSIKAGLVEVGSGHLLQDTISLPTPQPATPQAVMETIAELSRLLPTPPQTPSQESGGARTPIGLALPSVIKNGVVKTAAHIDPAWLGANGEEMIEKTLRRPGVLLNDADAAGLAEMRWGAGSDTSGTVIMLTFGTGIGTAVFLDGRLLPNTELGHLELHGGDAEEWASARVRTVQNLDWPAWIARVNEYLAKMHALFWPDVFILGGAVSERYEEFAPLLRSQADIRPAHFGGQAGVMGAALAASLRHL